jgi:tRNA nucleotidyltransferase/poly(A) polymerase
MTFRKFLVGGAVRDRLMGVPCNDFDYVVVGATPADLEALGYKNVGESFPVFMDENGDQYALARKERKVGEGYHGFEVEFDPTVTLAEDLSRRDLTINAMALDLNTGEIEDPFGGKVDLERQVLRHVSDAFSEDPLRVVRLARFAARFPDFTIADETLEMVRELVDSGEMDSLADERFWTEMVKVFEQSPDPMVFFQRLNQFGVLTKVKFFKDVFGEVNHMKINGDFPGFMDQVLNIPLEDQLEMFVAIAAHPTATMQSQAIPLRVSKLFKNLWMVRDMTQPTPELVTQLITMNRGWDPNPKGFMDLVHAMHVAQVAGEKFPIKAGMLNQCGIKGRALKADEFLHMKGSDIGKAMAKARLAAVTDVMKG